MAFQSHPGVTAEESDSVRGTRDFDAFGRGEDEMS